MVQTFPYYQIAELLNENSKTVVYRAYRSRDRRAFILKTLKAEHPTPVDLAKLKHEYDITKNLNILGIVKPYSLERYNNNLLLVLEDFGGKDLAQLLAAQALELPQCIKIAIQIAHALGELHYNQIIHKDIKPQNIIVNLETEQVKLGDFSISSQLDRENPTIDSPNLLAGTLAYMSPEQTGRMNRTIDYRTDFYSFGVTLYEMLTGQLPFKATDPMELIHCHIAKQPIPPCELKPDLPRAISYLVLKLLAKTAEERYQSSYGIKADLEACLNQFLSGGNFEQFPLGRQDFSVRFEIPQKLYGREAEVSMLIEAFERASQGKTEMMLVSGYSGIGKSSLVNEVHKPIVRQRGFFINGKFDQFQRNIPYASLIQAVQELVRQILTESEDKFNAWREKILDSLGTNGQVIIDVIPEVELIVGKQPSVPHLGPTESQNRFNLVFQKFIGVFTQKEHPLVLFLDDLQWADSASLKFIKLLMTEPDSQYLLLIGAYRDNEVSQSHPLMLTLHEIEEAGATVNNIKVGPLDLPNVTQLIIDTFHCDREKATPLAELCIQKTQGNPFFLNQLLKSLYADRFFEFDLSSGSWQWDWEKIKRVNITDNVVDLMSKKIRDLAPQTQEILKLAACIGNKFDLDVLAVVSEKSRSATATELWEALREGLILPLSDSYKIPLVFDQDSQVGTQIRVGYKFLHDRVQQAAYSLINEQDRQKTHLKIGQLLLKNSTEQELEEKLFDIVNHLNVGAELITDSEELYRLAQLNFRAGTKAKESTAYEPATACFIKAIELLPGEVWQEHYELTFALHRELSECEYLCSKFERAEELFDLTLNNSQSDLDKAQIQKIRLALYDITGKYLENSQIGSEALANFGLRVPTTNKVDILSVFDRELQVYRAYLENTKIADLIDAPEMANPQIKACMNLLMNMTGPAYFTNQDLLALICLKMVNLSIEYGNSDVSSHGYAFWGIIAGSRLGEYEAGYEFGQLALKLNDNYNNLTSKVFNLFGALISPWRSHFKASIPLLRLGYQAGVETGDVYTSYNSYNLIMQRIIANDNFASIIEESNKHLDFLRRMKNWVFVGVQEMDQYFIFNWQGLTKDKFSLSDDRFNEAECVQMWRDNFFNSGVAMYNIFKSQIFFFYGDYANALNVARESQETVAFVSGIANQAEHYYYYSLILTALYPTASDHEKRDYWEILANNRNQLKIWAENCPDNFLNKYLLVEAEVARITGQFVEAIDLYDRAIKSARENGFIQNEALANELAAKFWFSKDKEDFGELYLKKAHYSYQRWGAKRKAEDLEAQYPQLLLETSSRTPTQLQSTTTSTTNGTNAGILDLNTVVKASHVLASELILDKLLAKLMKIIIENAGAEIGHLILKCKGELLIEASGAVDADNITILQSIPIKNNPSVSQTIINYVARTKESVVLNDATCEGNFTNDPYIQQHQPKSILCFPLINQGQLVSLVYLENNLTTGAFTPDRLEVLKILSTQAAISIENARLYAEVTESERRLTQFLEAMPVGVAVHTPTGQLHYANQSAQQLLGINILPEAETEQLTKAFQVYRAGTDQLYPTDQLPIVRSLCGETVKVDDMELHQPDKILPVELSATPIFDETGKIVYAIAAFQDITERKQAEKLLADYNRTLEIQVAQRTQELAQALDDLKATQEELIQSAKMAALGQLIAGIAHEINTPLGAIRSSAGNISNFLDQTLEQLPTLFQSFSEEDFASFLGLLQHSLRQKLILSTKEERQIKRALKRELEASEIEDADIIAERLAIMGVSDKIDTFLPWLKKPSSLQIIEIAYKLSELKRGTATINMATDRASKVVFALKTYARYDQSSQKRLVNLADGIETVLTLYQNQLKQGVEVIRNYTELPPVHCYPDDLNQLWTNLIHNALQAMENRGTLTIDVTQANQQAKISITDSGTGIPPEIQSKIFQPFFTTKLAGEGSGLGLDIVKKIIEKHQGHIEFESIPGQTTFTVLLPMTIQ
jgi:PAS domain S-box-containing protein